MIPASVGWLGCGRGLVAGPRGGCAAAIVCTAFASALFACGAQAPSALDPSDALALQHAIAAVRTSAGHDDEAAALAGLDGLRARIDRLAAAGKLPRGEAARLRTGVAQALAAAERELQPPAPIQASSPPAVSAPAPPAPRKAEKKLPHKEPGHGHAKHGERKGSGD
jgi:hypothetical protein